MELEAEMLFVTKKVHHSILLWEGVRVDFLVEFQNLNLSDVARLHCTALPCLIWQ